MKVLVLWTGFPNGHRIVRSLKRGGFDVLSAHPEGAVGGRGWGHLKPLRYPSALRTPDAFVQWVARVVAEHGVDALLPVDEDVSRVVAFRRADLGNVDVVGPSAAQYDALCNKGRLGEATFALGLPTPATVEVESDDVDRATWPPVPCMVKPRTSGSEIDAPQMVRSHEERDALVARLVASGHGAVLQEAIEGQRWVVQSVRGPGVFEYVVHRVDLEWPRGCGLATMKRPFLTPRPAVDAARALLDSVDYHGPSGISMIERDGQFYVHDVNLRLGATAAASINAGFDFPRRAVEAALGLGGRAFSGSLPSRAVHMRLDKELEAIMVAAKGRDRRALAACLARVVRVGIAPRGMLDPSPLNPFWVASIVAAVVPRPRRRPDGGVDDDSSPAPPVAHHRMTRRSHVRIRTTRDV